MMMKTIENNNSEGNNITKIRTQKTKANRENQLEKSKKNQSLAEIAEQGFTVRNGHNPNKPNPLENSITEKTDTIFSDDLNFEEEELDDEGNIMVENDEFDNPSDYFENTDDVVY